MKNRVLGLAVAAGLMSVARSGMSLLQSGAVVRDLSTPDIKDLFLYGPHYHYHNGFRSYGRSGVRAAKRAKAKRKGIAQAKANGCYRSAS